MGRKLIASILFAATAVPALLVVGCASGNGNPPSGNPPYSLTGSSQDQVAQEHEAWRQRMMYTDDKGHYRPELAAQNHPIRYIPQ
jgi:hypothetical protein